MDTLGDVSGAAAEEFSFGLVKWGDAEGSEKVVGNLIGMANPKGLVKEAGEQVIKQGGEALDDDAAKFVGSSCARKKPSSFVAGSPVLLAHGRRIPIEEVRIGDEVVAIHDSTGERGVHLVEELIRSQGTKRLVELVIAGRTIVATAEHPMWDAEREEWRRAEQIVPGHRLLQADGSRATVGHVRSFASAGTRVYNLTVADAHTYFAGAQLILVHNTGCEEHADLIAGALGEERKFGERNRRAGKAGSAT